MDKDFEYEYQNRDENIKIPPRTHKRKKNKKKKKKNVLLKILFRFIILLIILIVVTVGVFIGYVYNKLSRMDYEELPLENIEVNEGVSNKGYLNIALFGIDARSDSYKGSSGSDCILIISINQESKEVKMVSVYRDSYLCYDDNKYTKITDTYRRYGAEKTINVLNRNLDLDISEYVVINFSVVVDVVDYVGGVEIEISNADLKYINDYIDENIKVTGKKSSHITEAGKYTLDGVQALAYARIRYVGTDINRTERQREVLMKAFDKVKKMNAVKLNGLIDKVLPSIKTTISQSEIISLALSATQYNVTANTGFPYEWKDYQPSDVYYLAPRNLEENVEKLHKELFGEDEYQVSKDLKKISDNLMNKTGIK